MASNKFENVFQMTGYHFENVFKGVYYRDPAHKRFEIRCIENIKKSVNQYMDVLKARDELVDVSSDENADTYNQLFYALSHLKKYINNVGETHISQIEALIFTKFARKIVSEMESHLNSLK